MRFDVHEEIEQGVFNTSSSLFWTQFREAFADHILARYRELRTYSSTRSSYTEQSFLEYFYDKQISKISETNYNNNFKQKYLMHEDYLFMMHGRQYEYFRRWISQRLYFIDSYYEYGEDWGKESTIRVEYGDFATVPVTFQIQTYKPSYVAVKFTAREGNTQKLKVPRGATITFQGYVETATDQEVILFNSPNIKAIGDISPYSPKVVELSRMTKLTSLCVGSEDHPNPNLSSISLGNNTYLTRLIAENCTAISGQIDVSNCTNLQYISTVGSTIPYVRFNANGGALQEANFSYATTTVNMNNFQLLETISFESLDKLTTLQITNCPIITGYITNNNSIEPGYIMNILNEWEPTDPATRIELNCYGNVLNYKFLDACSLLHENYGLRTRRINLSGIINYLGDTIPDRYSTYSSSIRENNYFPDLTITYPNVVNFSQMFADYKNINAIMSKSVPIRDNMGNISYQLRYYWKDLKEDKFLNEINAEFTEVGYRGRQVQFYDDDDMKLIADEIKDRMSPFSNATNFNEMFLNDAYLEYIHPDTFDHMNILNASTNAMFSNCINLKYCEFPIIEKIDSMAFNNCAKLLIYIPKETTIISDTAFTTTIQQNGQHPVFLFEGNRNDYNSTIGYIRDARFGIKKDETTHRAMREESVICDNLIEMPNSEDHYTTSPITVDMKYFVDDSGKLVYDVVCEDGSMPNFTTWNCQLNLDTTIDVYSNPLGISEMLYGSMKHFQLGSLKTIAVPTFNITNLSPSSEPLSQNEITFAKLFYDEITSGRIKEIGSIERLVLLTETNSKISNYFLQDNENIRTVICEKYLTEIGDSAFKNCNISEFTIQSVANESHLTTIDQNAFDGAKLNVIYIPDTVTYIGEKAYANNDYITDLKYSTAMTYVPIGCFEHCNTQSVSTTNIRGFNPLVLKRIRDYAFDGSKGLLVVQRDSNSEDPYNCYWAEDFTHTKFLDYFPLLEEIGNSAFRGIQNIRTIKLTPTLASVGSSAFVPPSSEFGDRLVSTMLQWDLSNGADYSATRFFNNAFAGRQFDWNPNGFGNFTTIIEKSVFIPKTLGGIDEDVFSPTSSAVQTNATLEFVISDAETRPITWSEKFAQHYTEIVYNYYTAYIKNNESLYFLLNDETSIYMKLLTPIPTVTIPASINYDSTDYFVTRLANSAFNGNEENLNVISFGEGSVIESFGTYLFGSANALSAMYVENTYDDNNELLFIPETVTTIGEGTPFKSSSWFSNNAHDDFIYLNDTCLGYGRESINLVDALSTSNPISIRNSTKVIYDNAFEGETITSIALPTSLERIGDAAFRNCVHMTNIDFLPCQNTLSYIGSDVFKNDSLLTSIRYTKALRHVGAGATEGCGIWKVIFDQGCQLDNSSYPFKARPDNLITNLDETITFMKISDSMGSFFTPGVGFGAAEFMKLSNISELILGEYTEYDLDEVPENELTESEAESGLTYYKLDLTDYYDTAYYTVNGVQTPIILHTTDSKFNAPSGTYTNDLNIASITANLLDQVDVIRIIMGYKDGETHVLTAKRDFVTKTTAAMYKNMFNNRVTTRTQS